MRVRSAKQPYSDELQNDTITRVTPKIRVEINRKVSPFRALMTKGGNVSPQKMSLQQVPVSAKPKMGQKMHTNRYAHAMQLLGFAIKEPDN